jgi:hypothetical protein
VVQDEPDDAALEEELRHVVARVDPVPGWLVQAAVDSFAWRSIDAELAELVLDSMADRDQAAAVRGPGDGRLLAFEAPGVTIDVEVTGSSPRLMLTGQLMPPQPVAVQIRQGDEVTTVEADDLGRFSAGPLRAGPVSLRCTLRAESGADRQVVTEWTAI